MNAGTPRGGAAPKKRRSFFSKSNTDMAVSKEDVRGACRMCLVSAGMVLVRGWVCIYVVMVFGDHFTLCRYLTAHNPLAALTTPHASTIHHVLYR